MFSIFLELVTTSMRECGWITLDLLADLNLLQKRCLMLLRIGQPQSFLFGFIINLRADNFFDLDDATSNPSHFGLILCHKVSIVYSE